MHAAAGKGGFAVEPAQTMFGPVFAGPAKRHSAGNAKIRNRGNVHLELPFLGLLRFETDVPLGLRKVRANGKKRRNWLKTIPLQNFRGGCGGAKKIQICNNWVD
jgi:hypothetical protein